MQDDIKEIKKMQRAMINGMSAMKGELLSEIDKLRKETQEGFKEVNNKIDAHRKETKRGFKDINNRADLLGRQLDALDEDAPTGEDFNKLVKRVDRLEKYQNFTTA